MTTIDNSFELYDGLAALAERYDGFICDLWGVLHDGVTAFPHALDALAELRRQDKRIVVLSNAPRRAVEVIERMHELGIEARFYDAVMTSGEHAWRHLSERSDPWYKELGRRCFHLGPDRDNGMRAGLDLQFVEDLAEADFVLNTGAHMASDTVETYAHELEAAAAHGLPMICANPDLEVIRGGKREICAGLLARRYEELGGTVRYHGKPHAEVYDECLRLLGVSDRERIVAVGDSLRTDIAGAVAIGVDGLLVVGGIHAAALEVAEGEMPTPAALQALCRAEGVTPTAAIPIFRW